MKKSKIFRRSFLGGFNRHDVMDYICALQVDVVSTQTDIAKLKEENSALKAENSSQQSRLAEAEEQNGENVAKIEALEAEITRMDAANKELAEKNAELTQQAEKTEVLEGRIGGMMADAVLYKEKMVSEAKTEIDVISSEYRESAKILAGDIDGVAEDIGGLTASVEESIAALTEKLLDVSAKIDAALKKYNARSIERTESAAESRDEESESQMTFPEIHVFPSMTESSAPADFTVKNAGNGSCAEDIFRGGSFLN